jgi:hypothetical protein
MQTRAINARGMQSRTASADEQFSKQKFKRCTAVPDGIPLVPKNPKRLIVNAILEAKEKIHPSLNQVLLGLGIVTNYALTTQPEFTKKSNIRPPF